MARLARPRVLLLFTACLASCAGPLGPPPALVLQAEQPTIPVATSDDHDEEDDVVTAQGAPGELQGEDDKPDWNDRFIDPVSAPLTFESPLVHTSVRPIVLRHEFPGTSLFQGGYLLAYAVQFRWAITDRIAFIATKDGRAHLRPGTGPDESGYLDLAAGFKFIVHDDPDGGSLITTGFTYEGTNGDRDVFQGNGNGLWRPFVSGAFDLDPAHVIASVAASLPVSGNKESQSIDYHLHFSPADAGEIVPLLEINGIHYTNNGRALAANFEGVDYANLGSNNVDGNDIITAAAGLRWKAAEKSHVGFVIERPLTQRKDIFDLRYTLDWVKRF